jgi:4-azaleucine resistance transporter AzlC
MSTTERALLRDGLSIGVAVGVVGLSFGVLARAAGVSAVMTCGMSLLIFGGGAQFLLLAVVQTGSDLTAGVLAALLLNARHIPFGLALAPLLRGSLARRVLSGYLIVDESTAFALAQPDPRLARRAFYTVGIGLWACWQVGTIIGALAGSAIADPTRLGLDAAFPAGLLAVLWPQLRERDTLATAVAGGVIALLASPALPAGGPILLAGAGVLVGLAVGRRA